jgi:hypothetical protein
MDINDFNTNMGTQKFIQLISDFLEIVARRITIISIRSGSTIIDYSITPDAGTVDQASQFIPNSNAVVE